jgi:hypothetical protein
MTMADMSRTRLRAWLTAGIWSIAAAGLVGSFFLGSGPEGFAADSLRHLTAAGAVAFGFFGYWLVLWVTRRRKGAPPAEDERDLLVTSRANQTALVVVLVWVFAVAIGLWVAYEAAGQVPAGWLWFLAYGSVVVATVTSAVGTLVWDGRLGGRG